MEREGGQGQPAPSDLSPRSLLPTPALCSLGRLWVGRLPEEEQRGGRRRETANVGLGKPSGGFQEIRVVQTTPLNISGKLLLVGEAFDPKAGCTLAALCSGVCGWDQTQAASLEVSIFPVSSENT